MSLHPWVVEAYDYCTFHPSQRYPSLGMDRVFAPDLTSDSVPRTSGVQCVCAFLHVTVSPDLASSIITASGHFVNPHELEIWSVSKAHFFN